MTVYKKEKRHEKFRFKKYIKINHSEKHCVNRGFDKSRSCFVGKEMLPFTEDEVYQGVSMVLTVVMAIMAWWKNNSFTNVAIEADKYKENLIKTQQLIEDEYFTDEEYENE